MVLTADAVGGVWQYTAALAHALVQDNVAVLVATMGPRPSASQRAELPASVELAESDFALEWMAEPWPDVDAAGAWLQKLTRQFHPDILHLNGYSHAALSWDVPTLIVAHSCVLSWWRAVHGCEAPSEWDGYRRRVQAGLQACDRIVAPSAFMAAQIAGIYGIDERKIAVIHNGLAFQTAAPRPKELIALAAGRLWDKAKNVGLLSAVARESKMPFYLVGHASTGASERLHALGQLPHREVLRWMGRAQFFAHPALYEPFGLAILEAARARCCLLLADTASARELWNGAALFLNPHDPGDWIAAINRLSVSIDECERLAAAACARSLEFSETSFAERYRQVYTDLLNARSVAA